MLNLNEITSIQIKLDQLLRMKLSSWFLSDYQTIHQCWKNVAFCQFHIVMTVKRFYVIQLKLFRGNNDNGYIVELLDNDQHVVKQLVR